MAITDYLEALGTNVAGLGLPTRGRTPPVITGLTSALSGYAGGAKLKRGMEEGRRLNAAKREFESRVGISYDIFAKLPADAQESILKNTGVTPDPYSQTGLDQFGGRTMQQLDTEGAPGRTAPASGSGIFEGLGGLDVGPQQQGPDLPPLNLFGKSGAPRAAAVNSYLGSEAGTSSVQQSLIESRASLDTYRKARLDQFETEMAGRADLRKSQIDRNRAAIKAMKALADRRTKPDEPIEDWEVGVGRSMGLMIPKGVAPTRSQFERILKFNRPAMAVVGRSDDLALAARKAEIEAGIEFDDKKLAEWIGRHTTDLRALAGDTAPGIVLEAVKKQLQAMRRAPDLFYAPAAGEEDEESGEIPGALEDEEDYEEDDEEVR